MQPHQEPHLIAREQVVDKKSNDRCAQQGIHLASNDHTQASVKATPLPGWASHAKSVVSGTLLARWPQLPGLVRPIVDQSWSRLRIRPRKRATLALPLHRQ